MLRGFLWWRFPPHELTLVAAGCFAGEGVAGPVRGWICSALTPWQPLCGRGQRVAADATSWRQCEVDILVASAGVSLKEVGCVCGGVLGPLSGENARR